MFKLEKYTLKQLRSLNDDMSREELADKTGLSYYTIMAYENDVNSLRKAKYEVIEKVAHALNTTPDHIFLNGNSD